jgi:hypothetical protein
MARSFRISLGAGRTSMIVAAAAWVLGCMDAVEPSDVVLIQPVTDTIVSGTAGQAVAAPLRVLVTDAQGTPLPGIAVSFLTKEGSVEFPMVVTSSDGLASPGAWTLGPRAAPQNLTARARYDQVIFRASARPGPVDWLWITGGAYQTGAPDAELPSPLTFVVWDSNSNPIPGVLVTFSVIKGGGVVEAASAVTDAAGLLSARWTLGPEGGLQQVRAEAGAETLIVSAIAACDVESAGCGLTAAVPCEAPDECGRIAFVSSRDGNEEIYSIHANGTGLVRLTEDPGSDRSPAWSPDGDRIAFVSDRNGLAQVYVMDADGSDVVRLTDAVRGAFDPTWSADGQDVAYATAGDTIWTVSANASLGVGASPLFVRQGVNLQPSWSPDGSRLAVVSDWNAFDFVQDVYVWTPGEAETAAVDLTGDNIFDHVDYSNPSWSPDGETLAIAITNTTFFGTYGEICETMLGVLPASGGTPTALFLAASFTESSWSPDGAHIAFTANTSAAYPILMSGGETGIAWIRTDGAEGGIIVEDGYSPDWTP